MTSERPTSTIEPNEAQLWEFLEPQTQGSAPAVEAASTDESTDEEFDPELDPAVEEDPTEYQTQVSWVSSPYSRLLLGGGLVFTVVGSLGVFLSGVMNSVNSGAQQPSPKPDAKFTSPMVPGSNGDAVGDYKSALAFQSQQEELKRQKISAKAQPKVKQPAQLPSSKSSPEPIPPTIAERGTSIPTPVRVATSSSPRPVSLPSPVLSQPPPVVRSIPPVARATNPDEEWERLSGAAMFGSVPTASAQSPIANASDTVSDIPTETTPRTSLDKTSTGQVDATANPTTLAAYVAQSGTGARKLLVGTHGGATLLTPVVATGSETSATTPKFILKLNEAMQDANGLTVLPQGTQIVCTVRSLDARSGLADLVADTVIINNQEYSPPSGTITIRGGDGGAILADKLNDPKREMAARDRSLMLSGALSKVGEILNRSTSETSISSINDGSGSSATSVTNSRPNVAGAVLQGAFSALSQIQTARSQKVAEDLAARPTLWYIPSGKALQVYVNQTIEF